MNLDTLARIHSEAVRQTVATTPIPDTEAFLHRRPARKIPVGLAWATLAVAATSFVVFLGQGTDLAPPGMESADDVPATTMADAPTNNEADGEEASDLLHDDPPVVHAPIGPEPRFDTSIFGEEQPLVPVEQLNRSAREVLTSDFNLIVERGLSVGQLPGTNRTILVVDGVINNPAQAGFGEAGRCIWVWGANSDGRSGECHQTLPENELRPIAVGLTGDTWAAWEFLPDEAAVAVLNVDGVDRFWQRPRGGVAVFTHPTDSHILEIRVLDEEGLQIARGDRTPPDEPTEPTIEPIVGYGDFTGVPYEDIDWSAVIRLVVECMNDQGYAATLAPFGDGFTFGDIPESQNQAAQVAAAACRAGLRLPEPPD